MPGAAFHFLIPIKYAILHNIEFFGRCAMAHNGHRLQYNAPVTLTFFFVSLAALLLGFATGNTTTAVFFSVYRCPPSLLAVVRLFTLQAESRHALAGHRGAGSGAGGSGGVGEGPLFESRMVLRTDESAGSRWDF